MSATPKTTAILLAAGRSQRMGTAKALLPVVNSQGSTVTVIEHAIALCRAVDFDVRVVLGFHAERIREEADLSPAVILINPNPGRGQTSSIQVGVAGLDAAICLFPVDHALIQVATMKQLHRAFANRPRGIEIVIPTHKGRRGHPVLCSPTIAVELSQIAPEQPAHHVMRRDAKRVLHVDTADRATVRDFDTPEDFQELQGRNDE